jgi:hypothetical protein
MTPIDPSYHARRKAQPVCTGVLDYFPDALLAVAELSRIGNEQHNPGQPLHWAKEKSTDEPDALMRHLIQRGTLDVDGVRHSAKVAWRALALLQREIDAEPKAGELHGTFPNPKVTDKGNIPTVAIGPGLPNDDPLAQRPDETAKQHRDRVNTPWPDMRILIDETPSSNRAPATTPLARQPDDFSVPDDLARPMERRKQDSDRRAMGPSNEKIARRMGWRRDRDSGRRKGDISELNRMEDKATRIGRDSKR